MVDVKKFKIAGIRNDGKNAKIIKLASTDGNRISFKPGQFVNLYLLENGNPGIFRQFSVASPPGEEQLEFCIKILDDGKFTAPLGKMQVGDQLGVVGPFGHFSYLGQQNCIFVAAGTGIAPIMSMLREIKNKKINGNFTLFYSNKTYDSILYYDELKGIPQENNNIKIVFTLTQEEPEGWAGEKGRVSKEMLDRHVTDPKEASWYCCGPLEFVKMLKEYALSEGTPPEKIKIEGWG